MWLLGSSTRWPSLKIMNYMHGVKASMVGLAQRMLEIKKENLLESFLT